MRVPYAAISGGWRWVYEASLAEVEIVTPANTTIAVPVYQRQYRWQIDRCEQLLADIRAVSTGNGRHRQVPAGPTENGTDSELGGEPAVAETDVAPRVPAASRSRQPPLDGRLTGR
jgi:hypothetical protein